MTIYPLEIRTDADMNFTVLGFVKATNHMTEQTPTTQQGEKTMSNKLFTVISFDDETEKYEVVGTTASDITGEDLVDLFSKGDEETEFEKVIAELHNYQMAEMASIADSRARASRSGMTKAQHTPIVMRKGEWASLMFILEQMQQYEVNLPEYSVAYGVSVEKLMSIISDQTKGDA